MTDVGVTRYADLTRARAAVVVALLVAVTAWLVVGARTVAAPRDVDAVAAQNGNDVAYYRAVVTRMRAGQGYYDAAAVELRARHFPMRPAFAWRQPTCAWLLSLLPHPFVASGLLALLGAAVVLLTHRWVRQTQLRERVLVATALMIVTMSSCLVANFVYMQEAWAGVLIALSVCLYALDRWQAAVLAGLAALAFRELALLPCGVAVLLALRRRRYAEVAAWSVGLAVYGALMVWHFAEVSRRLRPDDLARGWLALGGGSFLVAASQWSGALVFLPRWAVAFALPFIVLGLAGWRDRGAALAALVVGGYLIAFSFVGNSFNDYWGAMYAPLLSFGLIVAPDCVQDLYRVLTGAVLRERRS